MREEGGNPPGHDASKPGHGGVRAPVKGESSSANVHVPSDADTIFGAPGIGPNPSDSPTVVGSVSRVLSGEYSEGGQHVLTSGHLLAQRYEILSLLGEGGMGAVYKARDVELGRTVALKVIRPDLARNRAILDRFKQELILATQVTHRNVVRIYDLGEAEGIKFITMEYVEGEDLAALIHQRAKLPPHEAVNIIEQVCRALEAAHSVGVIHRDLKPQNIMQEKGTGRILVMDFGLAKTLEGDRMTQTGAMVGTMEYMSPEQALAGNLDQRSDIFSLGLIFYELLTGQTPFRADSALASLIKRTQERVVPVSEFDKSVPPELSQIVSRSLERDVALRYQSAAELLADLELWAGTGKSGIIAARLKPGPRRWADENKRLLAGAIGLALLLIAALTYFLVRPRGAAVPQTKQEAQAAKARSLAILPFRNSSGDPKDDWIGTSVADMLSTDIGQSAHLHTVPTDRLHQVLSDLRIGPDAAVDPDMLRRVAQFSSADVLVSGQYARFGDQIVIDATIRDLVHDQTIPVKAQALVKDLPTAIDSLADSVRKNLALSADVVEELKAQSFKPNTKSVEALREYDQGSALMRAGKYLDALKHLQAATNQDSQFALAFSKLADAQSQLGFQSDAEQSSIRATDLANDQKLPLAEKYLISAGNARIMKDNKKALEAYENLFRSSPGDVDVQYELGNLYLQGGQYDKARAEFAGILKTDPKNIKALWSLGVVDNLTGNPQAALDSLTRGSSLAIQVDNEEQHALMLLSIGISYRLLNKPEEALRNYQESIAVNEKIGQKRGVAAALNEIAAVQWTSGKPELGLVSYNKALTLLREIGMKDEVANTLTNMGSAYFDLGKFDQALDVYKQALQIERDNGDQGYESRCLDNIAAVYLSMGDTNNAFTYSQQALQLREKLGVPGDIADTLLGLSEAYTATGQYDQAMTALMRALELSRQVGDGSRTAQVSSQIGLVLGYQGRFGAAVKSLQDAVNAFRQQGESGLNMAGSLNYLSEALAKAGRGDESAANLAEAEKIQQTLKNNSFLASLLNTRGDIAFFRGDLKGADRSYTSALQLVSRARADEATLLSKLNVAKVAVAEGRFQEAMRSLQALLNLKGGVSANLSLQIQLAMAQAAIGMRDYAHADYILNQQLATAKRSGVRFDLARIYYLLGTSARLNGSGDRAADYYRQAAQLLDVIRSDSGDNILHRADFKTMYDESKPASK
ncbi:MAG: eukaryotic-like serine/threonine-protein kinase [Acidobacteriaceae bacterium]|jgi:tetratricopeptide (TPR) repeat protein/predicted Ser/Thr protein kinase|nr:eukaryotic-like serine/threonine-protein kinase [Acidobacteriaceae bacterium]